MNNFLKILFQKRLVLFENIIIVFNIMIGTDYGQPNYSNNIYVQKLKAN